MLVLMIDDDEDDCVLVQDAFKENRFANEVRCLKDGSEAMDFLLHKGRYQKEKKENPGLILLDLNMPGMDGRQMLKEIKSIPHLRAIPVVILTTSKEEQDILRTYNLGANSYITKPVTFQKLVEVVKSLGKYWFDIVELPSKRTN